MQVFYAPDIEDDQYTLSEEESKHIVRVLRMQEEDHVLLMDGKGAFYHCEISDAHPKRCAVSVRYKELLDPRPFSLHLAVAPTKNIGRYEWFLEKATEIGVETITPIICQHSERDSVKHERMLKMVISAAKQARQAWLPELRPQMQYKNFIEQSFDQQRFIAHCYAEPARVALKKACKPKKDVLILIGPEGDFSLEELDIAQQAGFTGVSMGTSRLRTETAAIAACHTVHIIND